MKMSKMANRNAIYNPNHPKANNSGYILYSRYLMEDKIGRKLNTEEHIHHINGDKLDDRIENLMIVTRNEHAKIHNLGENGKFNLKLCSFKIGHIPTNRLLNDKDAKVLKEMIKKRNKLSLKRLADLLGFKISLLLDISCGRSYNNI